jgi:hypothetical protein
MPPKKKQRLNDDISQILNLREVSKGSKAPVKNAGEWQLEDGGPLLVY